MNKTNFNAHDISIDPNSEASKEQDLLLQHVSQDNLASFLESYIKNTNSNDDFLETIEHILNFENERTKLYNHIEKLLPQLKNQPLNKENAQSITKSAAINKENRQAIANNEQEKEKQKLTEKTEQNTIQQKYKQNIYRLEQEKKSLLEQFKQQNLAYSELKKQHQDLKKEQYNKEITDTAFHCNYAILETAYKKLESNFKKHMIAYSELESEYSNLVNELNAIHTKLAEMRTKHSAAELIQILNEINQIIHN